MSFVDALSEIWIKKCSTMKIIVPQQIYSYGPQNIYHPCTVRQINVDVKSQGKRVLKILTEMNRCWFHTKEMICGDFHFGRSLAWQISPHSIPVDLMFNSVYLNWVINTVNISWLLKVVTIYFETPQDHLHLRKDLF